MTGARIRHLLITACLAATPLAAHAQDRGNPHGEWRYWGGDAWSTRYSPLDQVDGGNFGSLEVAWVWRGDNFGPSADNILRATPTYVAGRLYTVAGARRTVAAIDPATGETLWTFREPNTQRFERSMRQNYGKGVAYDEVDGRGRIYVVTPAFFLHALDAETGRPIATFGNAGTIDLLADLGYPYDPDFGITDSVSIITNSSAPMIVDGVVIVGNSHEQGYYQTRKENVPGHILAYDSRTGRHLWKFNVVPQPGEFGHDTWASDAWQYTGNISSWAPMSADLERGIVYIPTDPPTNDYYGGHRPGNTLFSTSILALDVKTGRRVWHFQTVHHDLWNYDNPTAPNLVNVTVNGRAVPMLVQTTKQGFAYAFDRHTGEPVWPIEERPVPQSDVPGERTSPTQPFPTRPAAYEQQGISIDDLIDFTPALRQRATELVGRFRLGPLFTPPLHSTNADGLRASIHCPGANGGTNIPGGTAVDPETGILYVASTKACSAPVLLPRTDSTVIQRDAGVNMDWVTYGPGGVGGVDGLPLLKPPYGRITAIDMNTGETLWWIPNGDTPDNVKNHAALQGIDIPVTGKGTHATKLVTRSLLIYGEGRGGAPLFHAVDKRTGRELASVRLPAPTNAAPMTYMHGGKQYIVVSVGSGTHPGSLVALRLP
ncbi:MAG TPA: PQQ-binding-like beta-propeller repeat protein [Longimicrobiales bacterium]|nr:PQQ-binding-like beta-propeller repeat protein [Longimicrobiales bacterium]